MPYQATESTFEEATLQRLQQLGYRYQCGGDIERPFHTVVLEDLLRGYLQRRYHHLPPAAIQQAMQTITAPEGLTLDRRNMAFTRLFRQGFTLHYEEGGEEKFQHIYLADFEHPERNDFLVVNQLTITGAASESLEVGNTRRPDLIVYFNG